MLMFKRSVKSQEGSAEIHVFVDEEKGHTVYVSHSGQLFVAEAERRLNSKSRAAGFAIGSSLSCTDCEGC